MNLFVVCVCLEYRIFSAIARHFSDEKKKTNLSLLNVIAMQLKRTQATVTSFKSTGSFKLATDFF